MILQLDLTLADGADPDVAIDALFNFLASMGEDQNAAAKVDALVRSFNGLDR